MTRADSVGMFWEDVEPVKEVRATHEKGPRIIPPWPDTGWRPPREFPRLDSADVIAIDCETKDLGLDDHGPGWGRKAGHIVGIAVGDGTAQGGWYFPMRHEIQGELNLDPENVLAWCRDTFANANQPKLFANATYDIGWLSEEGVEVAGDILDVQIAEPMLDEYAHTYSLDALSRKYLGQGKPQDVMVDWICEAYGCMARDAKENVYRTPPSLVGPYAQGDVTIPPQVWAHQAAALAAQGMVELYRLESKLPRLLVSMRRRGVRVDLDKAQKADDELTERINLIQNVELKGINPNAPTDLIRYAKGLGVVPPETDAGNPSFAGKWLEKNMPRVAALRRLYKMRDTFIRRYIFGHQVDGRIHSSFNQIRSDLLGTVSGRFSGSNPNLQNIPGREDEFARMIRGLFVPDVGHVEWRRFDWSQIEYRFLIHFAYLIGALGADGAREMYRTNPRTDFHVLAQEIIWPGMAEMRKPAKNMNFGMVYGMGEDLMAEALGRSVEETLLLLTTYHDRFPFVRKIYDAASRRAKQNGYVTTILKRRARFPGGKETHKALNRVLQGSSADLMKLAMVTCDEAGLFDVLGAPALIVHDELDTSSDGSPEANEALKEVHHVMQTCIELEVPLIADMESGPDWGHTK